MAGKKRALSEGEEAKAIELLKMGRYTQKDIAIRFGTSTSTIHLLNKNLKKEA